MTSRLSWPPCKMTDAQLQKELRFLRGAGRATHSADRRINLIEAELATRRELSEEVPLHRSYR